eukprot:4875024-Amphidinium_carterae.1
MSPYMFPLQFPLQFAKEPCSYLTQSKWTSLSATTLNPSFGAYKSTSFWPAGRPQLVLLSKATALCHGVHTCVWLHHDFFCLRGRVTGVLMSPVFRENR